MKIVICVDDVHPENGWGLLQDKQFTYFRELNRLYGAKFNLFVVSNYHHRYPISKYSDWVNGLLDIPWIELCAHGHYHDTSNRTQYGECEFGEPLSIEDIRLRIDAMKSEWDACGYMPIGWRSPGWICSQDSANELSKYFNYVAVHSEHDRGIQWGNNIKKFYGSDGIHSTNITMQLNDVIMYQSHINGKWNDNIWSQENFDQLKLSLSHLSSINESIEFVTLNELI